MDCFFKTWLNYFMGKRGIKVFYKTDPDGREKLAFFQTIRIDMDVAAVDTNNIVQTMAVYEIYNVNLCTKHYRFSLKSI